MRTLLVSIFSVFLLAACSGDTDNSSAVAAKPSSKKSMPDDPDLASLYTQSCFSCHGTGAGGAPRTGNASAWQPRLDKGMDTLLDHTINGFRGMPPLGMCMDCDEAQFSALIEFMSTGG
ncbi:MAG: cytochrome c5 [Bermanella sp.]|jgi:cytochrome c5